MSTNSNISYHNSKLEFSNIGDINLKELNVVEYDLEGTRSMVVEMPDVDNLSPSLSSIIPSLSAANNCEVDTHIRPLPSHDSLLAEIHSMRQNISELHHVNEKIVKDITRLKAKQIMSDSRIEENLDYIYFLEREVARLDQYGRRENVELIGIPNTIKDGELESNVIRILHQIGLTHIQHYNIAACHRLRTKDRFGNYNTIVRFINRKDSISCFKNRKNLHLCRELGLYHIFITENLCPSNRSIFDYLSVLKKWRNQKGMDI